MKKSMFCMCVFIHFTVHAGFTCLPSPNNRATLISSGGSFINNLYSFDCKKAIEDIQNGFTCVSLPSGAVSIISDGSISEIVTSKEACYKALNLAKNGFTCIPSVNNKMILIATRNKFSSLSTFDCQQAIYESK